MSSGGSDAVHSASATNRFGNKDGWHWREPHNGEHFRRCSYCGSIHPEDLVASNPSRVDWSDHKYGWPHKFYVDVENQDPSQLFIIASSSHPDSGFPAWKDLPIRTRRQLRRTSHVDDWIKGRFLQVGTHSVHHAKFYSEHLADPDISDKVKEQIYKMCGLRFQFKDGKVKWWRYET